ncbi:MAG: hypothetical protein IPG39_19205 [Bacteroidetes bacterium]|nr:hypothetical protein [Bacteroidota bacterium]
MFLLQTTSVSNFLRTSRRIEFRGHRIYIRVLDDNQEIGHTIRRYFEIPSGQVPILLLLANGLLMICDARFDNCIPFSVRQYNIVAGSGESDNTTSYPNLAIGNHKLYLRTKSTDGKWSHTLRHTFEVLPSDDPLYVVEVEFLMTWIRTLNCSL